MNEQRTLTIGGSISVPLVSSLTRLDSSESQHTNNMFYFLDKSSNAVSRPVGIIKLQLVAVEWSTFEILIVIEKYFTSCPATNFKSGVVTLICMKNVLGTLFMY